MRGRAGDAHPDGLSRETNRDLTGRNGEVWGRRAGMVLLIAVCALGLASVFGQRSATQGAGTREATLSVRAPATLRSGLIGQVRIAVDAHRDLARPRIVISDDWIDGITVNTILPEPAASALSEGGLVLRYGPIPAGERLIVQIAIQVNPTTAGRRDWRIALDDGERRIAQVRRAGWIAP